MSGIGVVFDGVAGLLALVVHLVLFDVTVVDVLRGHTEGLGQGNEEVKQVDDLDAGVLFVDLLVFGPPFPGKTVDQLGDFLGHGPGVVEGPFGFVLGGKAGEIDSDLFVEDVLHAEDFVEFIGLGHEELVAFGGGRRRLFCKKTHADVKNSGRILDGIGSRR